MNDLEVDLTESIITASTLDQIQAMHSVLCYICANNLVVDEVVAFLRSYPESLLLEGTSPADSARDMLEMHMRQCTCFVSGCNDNRLKIIRALERGFEFYQGLHMGVIQNAEMMPQERAQKMSLHTKELCRLEHSIRELQFDEIAIRSAMLDATLERRTFSDELQKVDYQAKYNRRPLSRLACGRGGELESQRSVLQYYMEVESAKIVALEKKREVVLREIRFSHRMQVALLKKIFGGCQRHVCETVKRQMLISHK